MIHHQHTAAINWSSHIHTVQNRVSVGPCWSKWIWREEYCAEVIVARIPYGRMCKDHLFLDPCWNNLMFSNVHACLDKKIWFCRKNKGFTKDVINICTNVVLVDNWNPAVSTQNGSGYNAIDCTSWEGMSESVFCTERFFLSIICVPLHKKGISEGVIPAGCFVQSNLRFCGLYLG